MKRFKYIIFLMYFAVINSSYIIPTAEKIQWLSFEEMAKQYASNPKPILVDVYTGWCGWCKVMDKETYTNDKVVAYINKNYYAVKFDAESAAAITFGGKTYNYNATYRTNDLAIYLLYGQLSYPTTVFLSAIDAQPAPLPGYLKPKQIEAPLKYFGDGAYKQKTFDEFAKGMKGEW